MSEQFNGGNGSRHVSLRQVEVVNEDDALLAHGWPKHTLAAAIQLGHDDVLGVVDVGASRKVDDVGDETLLGQTPNKYVGEERFSGSAGSNQTYFENTSRLWFNFVHGSSKPGFFLCAPFLSKMENGHLFSSSLPRLDKFHETSRIFPRTEQTFASARSFGVIS